MVSIENPKATLKFCEEEISSKIGSDIWKYLSLPLNEMKSEERKHLLELTVCGLKWEIFQNLSGCAWYRYLQEYVVSIDIAQSSEKTVFLSSNPFAAFIGKVIDGSTGNLITELDPVGRVSLE